MAVRVWNRTIDPTAGFAGTLTCVARVAGDPGHRVAVSAAHVIAPLSLPGRKAPRAGDDIVFEIPGRAPLAGTLWSWIELQRRDDGFSNRFDAALVTVAAAAADALTQALNQPASVDDPRPADTLAFDGITSRASGVFDGLPASGPLIYPIIDAAPAVAAVDFVNSLRARLRSAHGDSGSLLRCGDRAVGMLIAEEGAASRFIALRPLLREFNLAWPGEAAAVAPPIPAAAMAAPPVRPAPLPAAGADGLDTLARTLWGEARGEPLSGIRAVAAVVMNRATHPTIHWWGTGVVGVCRAGHQFSCWNGGDPNLPKLLAVDASDDRFRVCTGVARDALEGRLADERRLGATHYHDKRVMPDWARGHVPCADIRNHLFYNHIEG